MSVVLTKSQFRMAKELVAKFNEVLAINEEDK